MPDLFEEAPPVQATSAVPLAAQMRPRTLEEYSGQEHILGPGKLLRRAIEADRISSIILFGPPGVGKTTLAQIIAHATASRFERLSGVESSVADMRRVIAGAANRLQTTGVRTILFIDEIHRLQPAIEEYLYPAMEDYKLDIIIDQGPNARSVRLNLPKFTLMGATTRSGMISAPLRSRFGMTSRLDYYTAEELQLILQRSAGLLGIEMDAGGAMEVAARSRGTPRVANNLLKWVRDFAQVKGHGIVTAEVGAKALAMLEIDSDGFDEMDKRIVEALILKFNGGPVGVSSLAVAVGEDAGTLEDVHEPYLIMQGYLKRTAQGRVAMPRAYQKLGIKPPVKRADQELFGEE